MIKHCTGCSHLMLQSEPFQEFTPYLTDVTGLPLRILKLRGWLCEFAVASGISHKELGVMGPVTGEKGQRGKATCPVHTLSTLFPRQPSPPSTWLSSPRLQCVPVEKNPAHSQGDFLHWFSPSSHWTQAVQLVGTAWLCKLTWEVEGACHPEDA